MLVPGLATPIALAGASHGALLDHACSGSEHFVAAPLFDRQRSEEVAEPGAGESLAMSSSRCVLRRATFS
jgi:hypothetical protein